MEFIPQILKKYKDSAYATMMVKLKKCPKCLKWMIYPLKNKWHSQFPIQIDINFDAQIKNAEWVKRSEIKVDDNYICVDCANAGRADFKCALCKKRYPTCDSQESFGDPPEFLCKLCYQSVSAKTWVEKINKLYEKHKYDFE